MSFWINRRVQDAWTEVPFTAFVAIAVVRNLRIKELDGDVAVVSVRVIADTMARLAQEEMYLALGGREVLYRRLIVLPPNDLAVYKSDGQEVVFVHHEILLTRRDRQRKNTSVRIFDNQMVMSIRCDLSGSDFLPRWPVCGGRQCRLRQTRRSGEQPHNE